MIDWLAANETAAIWLLAGLFGFGVLALLVAINSWIKERDPVSRRLVEVASDGRNMAPPLAPLTSLRLGLQNLLARLAKPAMPKSGWLESSVRRDLMRAGFHGKQAVPVFMGIKVAAALLVPIIMALIPALNQRFTTGVFFIILLVCAGVGYIIPGVFLDKLAGHRGEAITRELPEVLDLLVIAVEAGLGLDAAIKRVAYEVRFSCPIMSKEMNMVSLELKAGIARDRALRNLAMRCGVDEVNGLVTMMIQADRFGVSVGRSLRVHSDAVRTKRRQLLEEKAAKIPLKLLFPVLFLIFPAIMVVMAGPAMIKVAESMFQ